MTALDVLVYLGRLRIRLLLTDAGELHYRAKRGRMTSVLHGTVKSCRDQIINLLLTGEDTELPVSITLPETDYSRFLTWQTGKVPAGAQLMVEPLKAPLYHDQPSPPETVMGRPCDRKGCKPTAAFPSGQPASLYYRRTRLCVACYGRLTKKAQRQRREGAEGGQDQPRPEAVTTTEKVSHHEA